MLDDVERQLQVLGCPRSSTTWYLFENARTGKGRGMIGPLYLSFACLVQRRETVFHIPSNDDGRLRGLRSRSRLQASTGTDNFNCALASGKCGMAFAKFMERRGRK